MKIEPPRMRGLRRQARNAHATCAATRPRARELARPCAVRTFACKRIRGRVRVRAQYRIAYLSMGVGSCGLGRGTGWATVSDGEGSRGAGAV